MRAYVSCVLSHPVEAVWQVLGDFHAIDEWVPSIASAEVDGAAGRGSVGSVRILYRSDGIEVRERLVGYDERDHRFSYEFAGPHRFPLRRFLATVRLRPVTSTGQTFLEWFADFDADESDEQGLTSTFESIYGALIEALCEHLGNAGSVATAAG